MKKNIVITMGDPLGIGPEIIVKSLRSSQIQKKTRFFILGSSAVFQNIPGFSRLCRQESVCFLDLGSPKKPWSPKSAGKFSLMALEEAVSLLKQNKAQALVTAPISKDHVRKAGFSYPGQTEYLCKTFGVKKYAMMLFHRKLRIVLVTIHLPLRKIFPEITAKKIIEKLELLASSLVFDFKLTMPKIAVCGLNPHAGENGFFGNEEKKIILPAIDRFRKKKIARRVRVFGPVSADVVFHKAVQGEFDAVVCHYHDQGLIPLKTTGFDEGVNMTLGLPFVRTSPDHGTAFDIVGKGLANPASMMRAIQVAQGLMRQV